MAGWVPDDLDDEELPTHPPDDPFELLLWTQHQVISRAQARTFLSDRQLSHRVDSRRWQRPHRGVYVAHTGALSEDQRIWAAILAVGTGAVAAGLTAARLQGFKDRGRLRDQRIWLLHPQSGSHLHKVIAGVVVRRTSKLPGHHVRLRARPPHTTIGRSIADAAQWAATDEAARGLIAAAFQQGLVGPVEMREALSHLPRARRRALIVETIREAEGGAESGAELALRRLIKKYHLPMPTFQVKRKDRAGRTRYLDAYYERWQIHIEVDGAQHTNPRHWWDDMRRQNDVWVSGDRILRFPAWAIRHHPEDVATQIRAALVAAGWTL